MEVEVLERSAGLAEVITNRVAVSSLMLSRIIYAVNWYNMASVFSLVAFDFKEGVSGLGAIAGSFYLGIGLFQIPGALLAAKLGPKRVAIYGTVLASFAALLVSLASKFYQITLLRFVVGLGMALVYAPAVTLIAKYYRKGTEGLGIGLFQTAFCLGGGLGLFGWTLLGQFMGWRLSLFVSGVLGILSGALLLFSLPRDVMGGRFELKIHDLHQLLLDRSLLGIGVTMLGLSVGTSLLGSFFVFYLEDSMNVNPATAGLIGSLTLILSFFASPMAGRIFDKVKDARGLLAVSAFGTVAGVAMAAIHTINAAILSAALVGFSSGAGFTVGFSSAREANKSDSEYEMLAIGWVNSLSLSAVFWAPLVFSLLVLQFGYSIAWLLGSLFTLLLTFPVFILRGRTTAVHGNRSN